MRFLVLLCFFSMQFSFSQESKVVVGNKLKGKELAKKMNRVHDSLAVSSFNCNFYILHYRFISRIFLAKF